MQRGFFQNTKNIKIEIDSWIFVISRQHRDTLIKALVKAQFHQV